MHKLVCKYFKIRPEKHDDFLLRFKGLESFLYGDAQLIYFQTVRDYLRHNDDEPLSLELKEKPRQSKCIESKAKHLDL